MNDWDYMLTMRRLRQIIKQPEEWRMPVLPLFWSDGVNIMDRPIGKPVKEKRK